MKHAYIILVLSVLTCSCERLSQKDKESNYREVFVVGQTSNFIELYDTLVFKERGGRDSMEYYLSSNSSIQFILLREVYGILGCVLQYDG